MEQILFYILSIGAIFGGLIVITRKNPLHCALFLVLTFFFIAGLYLILGAYFLSMIQVIVYAGAIMVLFLFVIMFVNLEKEEEPKENHIVQRFWGISLSILLGIVLFLAIKIQLVKGLMGEYSPEKVEAAGNAQSVARILFTDYLIPFEVASILLLVAIVGAVVLAKKEL
jgi:NADH-quinone oxidoreductase subunit J